VREEGTERGVIRQEKEREGGEDWEKPKEGKPKQKIKESK